MIPRLRNIRAVRTRDEERPLLHQNDGFRRIRGSAVEPGDVAGNIRQQTVVLLPGQVFCELAIAFFKHTPDESELFHPRKCPDGLVDPS